MRSLLQFLALCAVASVCVCYESHESTESIEDLFVPPSQANSFISPQTSSLYNLSRRNGHNHYNLMRKFKSPAERRAETCEDYSPCRYYAFRHGSQQAYQRYFASRAQPQRPAPPPSVLNPEYPSDRCSSVDTIIQKSMYHGFYILCSV
ncbi:matrix Gla protein [Platichthys flesus]|uniref:matrix Gla protein n=1 Tax=Platichthys flesus TaxID=8260 RepID=UPI002DB6EE92|nr:matrix Gla protein [Platichthys flesus]XP_062263834.1 matrix Gla protein [Platichthys flesus]